MGSTLGRKEKINAPSGCSSHMGTPCWVFFMVTLVCVTRPPLDWNQSACSITSYIKTFCALTDQMGIVK